jgi:hypothetical protein
MFPHLLLFDHIRSRNVDEDVIKGIERTIMMTTSSPIIKHTHTRICACFDQVIFTSVLDRDIHKSNVHFISNSSSFNNCGE